MNTKAHSKLTFDQFAELAGTQANKHQRRGQIMMCVLDTISNEIYSAVVDCAPENVDPFYLDENIPAFLKYLLANHVALPVASNEPAGLALRPETIKVGQFYRTRNKKVLDQFPNALYFGAQSRDLKKHLIIIAPGDGGNGKTVAEIPVALEEYWDSFYEVPAPTFKS